MKSACDDFWDDIVGLAEGQSNDGVLAHLEACPTCRVKYEQLRQMMNGFKVEQFSPSADLIAAAKSLMPENRIRMGLLRTSLHLAGARSLNQDFQAVYEARGVEIRVMYTKVAKGWEITSRLPTLDWEAFRQEKPLPTDAEGRFQFLSKTIDDSGFSLSGPQLKLEVPNVDEAMRGPANNS